MNRIEYENSVRELLGVNIDLAELLPEDGAVQGFDKVGEGLSISTILMERYLEAANTAYEAVFRRVKQSPLEIKHLELLENKDNMASVTQKRAGTIEVEGSLIKFSLVGRRFAWTKQSRARVGPTKSVSRCGLTSLANDR